MNVKAECADCNLRAASLEFVPDKNGDRMIGELSRGNELPNVFLKRSNGSSPSMKIFCRLGNTSVIVSPTSSCRAVAIPGANSLDR